jgi:hypothetical protein
VLVGKEGSGYTIAYTGSEGTISGIQFGASIEEVLNNIIKPTEAIMSVLDINENLVPLQLRNFNEEYVNTKASNRIFFEVIAEDGVSRFYTSLYLMVLPVMPIYIPISTRWIRTLSLYHMYLRELMFRHCLHTCILMMEPVLNCLIKPGMRG